MELEVVLDLVLVDRFQGLVDAGKVVVKVLLVNACRSSLPLLDALLELPRIQTIPCFAVLLFLVGPLAVALKFIVVEIAFVPVQAHLSFALPVEEAA